VDDADDRGEPDAAQGLDDLAARAAAGHRPTAEGPGIAHPVTLSAAGRLSLEAVRHHLAMAWTSSDAGTEVPESTRLRAAKQAVMFGLRPVTSSQVPYNREVVSAVDRLTEVVAELVTMLDRADQRTEATLKRFQAAIATVELGATDLADDNVALAARIEAAIARAEAAEQGLVEVHRRLGAANARHETLLRVTAELVDPSGDDPASSEPDRESTSGRRRLGNLARQADARLLRRLAAVGRPPPEALRAWAAQLGDAVAEAAAATDAPVLDLASDGGEWLEVWADLGVPARGVDDDNEAADALVARGHTVVHDDPIGHLGQVDPRSLGVVSAAILADVGPVADLIELVDRAAGALRPGGLLVLAAAHPASFGTGDPQWADPRRRPLDSRTLSLLTLERGYSEAQVVDLCGDSGHDGDEVRAYAVLARTGPAAATG